MVPYLTLRVMMGCGDGEKQVYFTKKDRCGAKRCIFLETAKMRRVLIYDGFLRDQVLPFLQRNS